MESNKIRSPIFFRGTTDSKSSARELEESRQQYKSLFDYNPDGVYHFDLAGNFLAANAALTRLTGYPQEELLNTSFHLIVKPQHREKIATHFQRAAEGEPQIYETVGIRKDGTEFECQVTNIPIVVDGEVVGVYGIAKDTTERKQVERALREADKRAIGQYDELLRGLIALAQEFGSAHQLVDVYRSLHRYVESYVPCNGLFIALYDPQTEMRTCVYAMAEGREEDITALPRLPLTDSAQSQAITSRDIVVRGDLATGRANHPHVNLGQDVDPRPSQSSVAIPMMVKGRILGVYEVQSVLPAAFQPDHVAALRMAANLAAIAIENVRLLENEREQRRIAQASEQRFRDLFENANDIVMTLDTAGILTSLNAAGESLLGYRREEVIGRNLFQLLNAEKDSAILSLWQRMDNHFPVEIAIRTTSNHRLFLEINGRPIFQNDQLVGYQAIARDVTERHERQREKDAVATVASALRTALTREQMYPVVLEQAADLLRADAAILALVHKNRPAVTYEHVLGAWTTLLGSELPLSDTMDGLIVMSGEPIITPDMARDPRLGQPDLVCGVRTAVGVPLRAHGETLGLIWIGRTGTDGDAGGFSPADASTLMAIADLAANAIYRAQLYEQLQLQAQLVQRIIETVPQGLIVLDQHNHFRLVNPTAEKYLSFLGLTGQPGPQELLVESPLSELLVKPQSPSTTRTREFQVDERTFVTTLRSMATDETQVGSLMTLQDVTEERQQQERSQQQERLAAVGQLASGIAHDFNNVMAVITMYAELMQNNRQLEAKDRERLRTIYEQGHHASKLIEQILDFSRRSVMERRPMNLYALLETLVALWRRTLPETISFRFEAHSQSVIVQADETRLQQALMNLAVNASHAMKRGGTLTVSLQKERYTVDHPPPIPEMTPGAWVRLSVADTGDGIEPDTLPHIFEPFFTTKLPQGGSGLGLAQVYGIVQQHEGHIAVESQVGEGTLFTIYLPLLTAPKEQKAESPGRPVPSDARETILIVEDNQNVRAAMADILASLGYKVLAAANGRRALEVVTGQSDPLDLVISDMVMPEMGGEALFRTLRQSHPELKMVMMTGYPIEQTSRQLLEEGIVDWIHKPFDVSTLSQKVGKALQGNNES